MTRQYRDLGAPAKPKTDRRPPSKKQQALQQEAKRIALARRSLPGFIEYVIRDNSGNPVTVAPHQVSWWEHILYSHSIKKAAAILAPMGHSKTISCAVALPLYLLGLNPNLRIMLVSSGQDTAVERMELIGRYIEESPEYRRVFPWVKPDKDAGWNSTKKFIKRTGNDGAFVGSVNASVQAYGYETRGVGGRFDVMIFDDVVDDKNSGLSAKDRETVKTLCQSTWITRVEPGAIKTLKGQVISPVGMKIIIGTRYHEDDFYANPVLASPEAYCTMIQSVSSDYGHLDVEIVGSLRDPAHPVYEQYSEYEPPPIEILVGSEAAPVTYEF